MEERVGLRYFFDDSLQDARPLLVHLLRALDIHAQRTEILTIFDDLLLSLATTRWADTPARLGRAFAHIRQIALNAQPAVYIAGIIHWADALLVHTVHLAQMLNDAMLLGPCEKEIIEPDVVVVIPAIQPQSPPPACDGDATPQQSLPPCSMLKAMYAQGDPKTPEEEELHNLYHQWCRNKQAYAVKTGKPYVHRTLAYFIDVEIPASKVRKRKREEVPPPPQLVPVPTGDAVVSPLLLSAIQNTARIIVPPLLKDPADQTKKRRIIKLKEKPVSDWNDGATLLPVAEEPASPSLASPLRMVEMIASPDRDASPPPPSPPPPLLQTIDLTNVTEVEQAPAPVMRRRRARKEPPHPDQTMHFLRFDCKASPVKAPPGLAPLPVGDENIEDHFVRFRQIIDLLRPHLSKGRLDYLEMLYQGEFIALRLAERGYSALSEKIDPSTLINIVRACGIKSRAQQELWDSRPVQGPFRYYHLIMENGFNRLRHLVKADARFLYDSARTRFLNYVKATPDDYDWLRGDKEDERPARFVSCDNGKRLACFDLDWLVMLERNNAVIDLVVVEDEAEPVFVGDERCVSSNRRSREQKEEKDKDREGHSDSDSDYGPKKRRSSPGYEQDFLDDGETPEQENVADESEKPLSSGESSESGSGDNPHGKIVLDDCVNESEGEEASLTEKSLSSSGDDDAGDTSPPCACLSQACQDGTSTAQRKVHPQRQQAPRD
jgi:hypothetical protein